MAQRDTRSSQTRAWTRADLARLPDDGNRYGMLDGALLVTPQAAFDHLAMATHLAVTLSAYCTEHGVGVVVAPGTVPHSKSKPQLNVPASERRALDENTVVDVDQAGSICTITVEHASTGAGAPQFSFEQVAAWRFAARAGAAWQV